jgi:hypothetical protein
MNIAADEAVVRLRDLFYGRIVGIGQVTVARNQNLY